MKLKMKKSWWMAKLMVGLVFLSCSTPCVVSMIHDLIVGAENLQGALFAGSFAAIIAVGGAYLMYAGFTSSREDQLVIDSDLERIVLRMAYDSGGILDPARMAMETELSLRQAEMVLEELEERGYARLQVTRDGTLEYVFPSLEGDGAPDRLELQIEKAVADHRDTSGQESVEHIQESSVGDGEW